MTGGMLLLGIGGGCHTVPTLPPADTSRPGWTLRQGQALWRVSGEAPDVAGELLFAANANGRLLLKFSKNPLPIVSVQCSNELWRVDFIPQRRSVGGTGTPTSRSVMAHPAIWLGLARALNGIPPRSPLGFDGATNGSWTITNRLSGETISGFLHP